MTEWVQGRVSKIEHWTDRLFSLHVRAAVAPFKAGQFTKLALDIQGERIQRAYSYVNAPDSDDLIFYVIQVPEGKLSGALQQLQVGDNVWLTAQANGFFVLDELPPPRDLWMIATGTAIGPYLSMLAQPSQLESIRHIRLIHAVRQQSDLSYWPQMQALEAEYAGKLRCLSVVSREANPDGLEGRIPALLTSGALEQKAELAITAEHSHIMLCGNPQMVRDTQQTLINSFNLQKHLRRKPGQITSEHYW
ncbi:MAG: FAD-binding oxidoreductase [Plesiomonas sp.]